MHWIKQSHLDESYTGRLSLFQHEAPVHWLVVNFIRMSIVIIAYLVLIILWAVKSIRHNPIPFCRSEVHAVWWFTVHRRPFFINAFLLFQQQMITFSELLWNKSNNLNNGITSPVSQRESTGHAILIMRLIMLDTVVSRSRHRMAMINTDEPVWAGRCKIFSAKRAG